jgi:hypothetical protein
VEKGQTRKLWRKILKKKVRNKEDIESVKLEKNKEKETRDK